jgi:putative flippase GtrA
MGQLRRLVASVKSSDEAARVARFICVAVVGYAVNVGAFAALVGLSIHYLVAAVVSYGLAWSLNFGLHRRWTFPESRHQSAMRQSVRHALTSLLVLSLNLLLLRILVGRGVPEVPAQVAAVAVVAPVSFYLARLWAFGWQADPLPASVARDSA